jgi:hypothetical protein
MPKKFHLGWFTNFTVDEWNDPFAAGGGKPWNGKYYVEMAHALERACFDYLMRWCRRCSGAGWCAQNTRKAICATRCGNFDSGDL